MSTQTQTMTQSTVRATGTSESPQMKSKISAKKPDAGMIATIDFGDFLSGELPRVQDCLEKINGACTEHGFFQIVNHPVSTEIQNKLLQASRDFFALPEEEKMKLDQSQNDHNRGYQVIGAQKYEAEDTAPDLKEGFYVGPDLPWDHPSVKAKRFAHGPNLWPESLGEPFKETCMDYLNQLRKLTEEVLRAVFLALDHDDSFMEEFTHDPINYFKMNHYPKPPDMKDIGQKGHGAHKDFGCITLLLQDGNPGLEVWEASAKSWIQVPPTEGAFVVNLGNLIQRWTNDEYLSNIHRVINHSGNERDSVAYLYHGNPDFMIDCRESCKDARGGETYPAVSIEEFVRGKYDEVYEMAGVYADDSEKS